MDKKMLRKMAGKNTYDSGMQIWETGGVYDFDVEPHETEDDIDVIHARVRGSGIKIYNVFLEYDFYQNILLGGSCECPLFQNTNSICKHCVAAFLEYDEEILKSDEYREDEEEGLEQPPLHEKQGHQYSLDEYMNSKASKQKGEEKKLYTGKKTSAVIGGLLQQREMKKMLPLTQRENYGKVKLWPILEKNYDGFELSFKIGREKMYVLKDVLEFADLVGNMVEFSYGKQLEFVHSREAFSEESRNILDFILRWAESNRNKYTYDYYYGYSSRKIRYLLLDMETLEDFLLSMGNLEFEAKIDDGKTRMWRVSDQPLVRRMTLTGDSHGVEMQIEKISGYYGNKYLIYFLNGIVYLESKKKIAPISDFIRGMGNSRDRKEYINEKDLPSFCSNLLPQLKEFYEIKYKNFDEGKYALQKAEFEIYLDAPQKDLITCSLKAKYGEEKFDVFGQENEMALMQKGNAAVRDLLLEGKTANAVADWFNAYDETNRQMVLAEDDEKLYKLLTEGISFLQNLGTVFVSDALKRMRVVDAREVEVGISVAGDMLNLELSSPDLPLDQLAEILSKYEKKKKFYRLKNGEFVNLDSSGLMELSKMTRELGLSEAQLKKQKIAVPGYRLLYLEDEFSDDKGYEVSRDGYYKKLVEDTERVMNQEFAVPRELDGIMRDYQKKGFEWILRLTKSGFGGILADDMGLGKTLQVISVLLYEQKNAKEGENTNCLIVTPASLVYNWESEIERFAPSLAVTVVAGNAAQRAQQLKNMKQGEILITSYDLLKRDIENYEGIHFHMKVIDEAQFIKNSSTQAAKAVKSVEAKCRMALTGTPIENRLSELWSIFDYLMPGFLYSYQRFRTEIEAPAIQGESEEAFGRLRKLVRPFVLRRLKEDVLKDLPEKIEENMYAKLAGEQKQLYDAHVQRLKMMLDKQSDEEFKTAKIQVLAELTRLRQLCCDPALVYDGYQDLSAKSDMCIDLIENAIAGGHKILLFSQFTTMLERLEERLVERKINFYSITGSTPKDKRVYLVESFNTDDVPVFCISLKAGGTGLNLASADIVIHFDPWWNLAVQNQATDRAHRIGQKNIVTVYKLIARGTIEENIVKLQERKKELANQLLSGEDLGTGSFTREELLELLKS